MTNAVPIPPRHSAIEKHSHTHSHAVGPKKPECFKPMPTVPGGTVQLPPIANVPPGQTLGIPKPEDIPGPTGRRITLTFPVTGAQLQFPSGPVGPGGYFFLLRK